MLLFDKPGEENTKLAIMEGIKRGLDLGITSYIIASGSGKSAFLLEELLRENVVEITVVTHCTGFIKPDFQELSNENREKLIKKGINIVTATHALGTVGRAVRRKYGTYEIDEIIANSLRIFGQGLKVCVEISMMAADAGFVSTTKPAVVFGGTGTGIDCVVILKPENTHNFFDIKINEIICKPKLF